MDNKMRSSTGYSGILIRPLALLAESLQPYCNNRDFAVHKKIAEAAYDSVVNDSDAVLVSYAGAIKSYIMRVVTTADNISGKKLAELAFYHNFQWPLYDRCVEICQSEQLDLSSFEVIEKPAMPETIEDAVSWFTVAEIKPLLKIKGKKVGGKRAELEESLLGSMTLAELEPELEAKLSKKLEKYHKKRIELKYECLARFIKLRACFLGQIANSPERSRLKLSPRLLYLGHEDDAILARKLDGIGYEGIIQNGKVTKLLPLFPSDLTSLSFKVIR